VGVGKKIERKGVRGKELEERGAGRWCHWVLASWMGDASSSVVPDYRRRCYQYLTCQDKFGVNLEVIGGAGVRGQERK